MEVFDLGIAWNWEPDNDFVDDLNNCALKAGLRPYILHAYNFYSSLKDFVEGNISFHWFLDRTSDDDPTFKGLADFMKKKKIIFINQPDRAKRSNDKFVMHMEFINHNISVPSTVFLKPQENNQILELKVKSLPGVFVLKPADGASDARIVLEARSLDDVLRLREEYGNIPYLAQEKIIPVNLENKPAWFRVFWCLGQVIPCWWDPSTHIYDILTQNEIDKFRLSEVSVIIQHIARVERLGFFTSEIALNERNNFFVIDYVNDQPDMRKKSKFNNGVPDEIVDRIVKDIVLFVREKIKS